MIVLLSYLAIALGTALLFHGFNYDDCEPNVSRDEAFFIGCVWPLVLLAFAYVTIEEVMGLDK